MHPYRGIHARVEAGSAAQNVNREFVFAGAVAGVLHGALRQPGKQIAQKLRAVEVAAVQDLLGLSEDESKRPAETVLTDQAA
jgi:hypothetical protein